MPVPPQVRWLEDAARFRQLGAESFARLLERCATEQEAWDRQNELESLTLEQATAESGFSYSALEKMVRRGELENMGAKGCPRVRRGDLPRKARRPSRQSDGVPDLADRILRRAD